jgi:hypothetical protein
LLSFDLNYKISQYLFQKSTLTADFNSFPLRT